MNTLIVNNIFEVLLLNILVGSLLLTLFQKNPVYSLIFLIFSFLVFSLFLLVIGVEFIALLFLVIYVGAISVLFLFVLMMLNIKYLILERRSFYFFYGLLIGSFFFFLISYFFLMAGGFFDIIIDNFSFNKWVALINYKSDLESLGLVIYNVYYIDFILCGLVLLVSMIGAISLVISFNQTSKFQLLDKQVKRGGGSLNVKKSFKTFIKRHEYKCTY